MEKNWHIRYIGIIAVLLFAVIFLAYKQARQDNKIYEVVKNLESVKKNVKIPSPTVYPSRILNLTNWKITVPIGDEEEPTEIKQPQLATYKLDPWFVVAPDGKGVQFRAPVNSVTTSGSNYPRSELREMTNNGKKNASWSSTYGTHSLFIDQAITAVPKTKKQVVAGQIHDKERDILVIRLDYPRLYVNVDGKNVATLDPSYSLGKRFTAKIVAGNGQTSVYYNGNTTPIHTLKLDYTGAYFKVGAYTQSNCGKESASQCNAENYGEVVVYQVTITHQ